MNTIELRLQPSQACDDERVVHVLIDGRDLIDRMREFELPQAALLGEADLAGSYGGLRPGEWSHLPEQYDDGRAAVLGCACGEVGCWPLRVRITRGAHTVVWSDFEQPHRDWSYDGFGPFTFAREQYDAAVADVIGVGRLLDPPADLPRGRGGRNLPG